MKHALRNQLKIVPVLWLFHVMAVLLSSNCLPFVLFLERVGLVGFDSFSCALVFIFSIIAFALNMKLRSRFHPTTGGNFICSIAASVVIANLAFWTMTVPLFVVLLSLGLVGT